MLGTFTAFYLNADEFKYTMEINKKFEPAYTPHLTVEVLHHYDESNFDGIIINNKEYLSKHNARTSGIMNDYDQKKDGYFTFDGVRFFKIVNAAYKSDLGGIIIFTFLFISTPSFSEKNMAFMIMPFKYEELNKFYYKNIKQYLSECDLHIRVYRSDDFTGSDVVADTIEGQIKKAEFIICDITHCNKNVFFELGFARGKSKNIIFLLEHNKPADFFDVNHIRRIEYSYEREVEFQELLRGTLISIRNNTRD